jgi:hypothetical protein
MSAIAATEDQATFSPELFFSLDVFFSPEDLPADDVSLPDDDAAVSLPFFDSAEDPESEPDHGCRSGRSQSP